MIKLTKQQEKALEHCRRVVTNTQKVMELIKTCPVNNGMIYAKFTNIIDGDGYAEAVFTPLSYRTSTMKVFVHASPDDMLGDLILQYPFIVDFKKWESSMAPLIINWRLMMPDFKAKVYNTKEAL
jgi:hypothetical protein